MVIPDVYLAYQKSGDPRVLLGIIPDISQHLEIWEQRVLESHPMNLTLLLKWVSRIMGLEEDLVTKGTRRLL